MSTINFVGHFLKNKGYHETFKKLEEEHGKPIKTGINDLPNKELLDEIIHDRFNFKQMEDELSQIQHQDFQSLDGKEGLFKHWKTPFPQNLQHEIPINEVVVSVEYIHLKQRIIMSTAKQKLLVFNLGGELVKEYTQPIGKLVIKKILSDGRDGLYLVGMNGVLYKFEFTGEELEKVGELSIHRRLIIDMKYVELESASKYIVSVGFDKLIRVIDVAKFEIVDTFEVLTVPTCFDTIVTKANTILGLVGYTESTLLDLIAIDTEKTKDQTEIKQVRRLYKISINDAEFITSNFSPRGIQFTHMGETSDTIMAAVSTSHEPYMRCIIVPITELNPSREEIGQIKRNQIVKNLLTMSPQDKFSNPTVVWRAGNQGIWVLGDDGKTRGLDLITHEPVEFWCHDGKVKFLVTVDDKRIVTIGDDRVMRFWTN